MGYREMKAEFDNINPEQLMEEQYFRYWLLRILFELNSNLDSLSASYRKLVTITENKNAPKQS